MSELFNFVQNHPDLPPKYVPSLEKSPGLRDALVRNGMELGLENSQNSANAWTEDEKQEFEDALYAICDLGKNFTTDDIWQLLPNFRQGKSTKGIGAVMGGYAKRKVIENLSKDSDIYPPVKSIRNGTHAGWVSVWRPL
jgi:hypothetical protein